MEKDDEQDKVAHLVNYSIMVRILRSGRGYLLTKSIGVDAVNTSLEVLIFAGVMMLGQGWKTVLILFSGASRHPPLVHHNSS